MYATGIAKLQYRPRVEFMELLVDECEARGLEDFNAQDLANMLNGEDRGRLSHHFCLRKADVDGSMGSGLTMSQGSPSWGTTLATASWTCSLTYAWRDS
jgi:hypothetical protein